ncbi:serine/threonine-protein kinase-like protein [Rhexocercosporidium sp. MPI-PUGE-AT-0058]|nr:serine/threonine-protein kinase-like protein [Rhexocercosporidium sp. MPI-PUGE-AT-0058]
MEVCEQNEAFVEQNGDFEFSHIKIILREGNRYYYAITSYRYPVASKPDLLELELDCYMKRPSLLYYGDTEASTKMSCLLCMVENDRITGFCFIKYGVNLLNRVTKNSRPFDIDLCLRGIRQGIRHLHSLNLIHYDLNPTNILIDGEKLGFKARTRSWTSQDFKFARPKNNEYKLLKIRDFLFQVRKM